jgi:hypothetical protein
MTRDGVTEAEVETILDAPQSTDFDERGNLSRGIVVIVARGSFPRRVVTLWTLGRRR